MTTDAPTAYTHFLGIDVSKATLDLCLADRLGKIIEQTQIANDSDSWTAVQAIFQKYRLEVPRVLICGEHTGIYTYHLLSWAACDAHVWVESGKRIKHSQGILRGKTDAKDAARIALYAQRFVQNAQLWQPLSETIEKLRDLTALRDRLLGAFNALRVPLKEQKNFMRADHYQLIEKLTDPAILAIKEQLETVEKQIKEAIQNDDRLKKQLEQLDSIPGIAEKTAVGLIVKTKGFTAFKNARQFACHAGIAPFEYSSGTSVRAKTRVSVHGDREIKTMLHLSAMAAVKAKGVLQDYYKRKQQQGKSKMSALNAVRNKIALIAFSLVKNNKKFDNNFQFSFELS